MGESGDARLEAMRQAVSEARDGAPVSGQAFSLASCPPMLPHASSFAATNIRPLQICAPGTCFAATARAQSFTIEGAARPIASYGVSPAVHMNAVLQPS